MSSLYLTARPAIFVFPPDYQRLLPPSAKSLSGMSLVNALRGHLAEHGVVAPQGLVNVRRLAAAIDGSTDDSLPSLVRELGQRYLDLITRLDSEIAELEKKLRRLTRDNEASARLQTMPEIGHVTAAAIEAFAPPLVRRR